MTPHSYSRRAYWVCQALGWGGWTAIGLVAFGAGPSGPTAKAILTSLWFFVIGLAASHLLTLWIRRQRWMELAAGGLFLRIAPAILLCSLGITLVNAVMSVYVFHWFTWKQTALAGYLNSMVIWLLLLIAWFCLYFGAHALARSRRAETYALRLELTAQQAQLSALRSQVNPHFMFNCLNSIRALIPEDPDGAQRAVTELSNLLRYSLQSGRTSLVSVRDELAAVEDYLRLEKVRFEERLTAEFQIEEAALERRLPPMLMQTLVENAIKHGIAPLVQGGTVVVEAHVRDGELLLRVTNPGQVRSNGSGLGLGLQNARERLQLLHGAEARLTLSEQPGVRGPAAAQSPASEAKIAPPPGTLVVAEVRIPQ